MKKLIIFTILMSAICSGLSCNIEETLGFDVTQPEVEYSSPSNHQTGIAENSNIIIKFSEPMDTIKTSNSFSLSTNSGKIEGQLIWNANGDILTFDPFKDLNGSEMYTISVSTGAEDAEGNDLKAQFFTVFYINNDLMAPEVESTNEPTAIDDNIVIAFTEAIDIDTLFDGITVSPTVQGTFEYDAIQRVISFNPTYNLSYTTMYTVTVGTQLKDINGNSIQNPYSFNFTVGDDFTGPVIATDAVNQIQGANTIPILGDYTENSGMEKDCDIEITFNESIDFSSLNELISFNPSADFYVYPDPADPDEKVAIIQFRQPLESETRYTMKLPSSISDIHGNQMNKEYVYFFTTDGENSKRPHVIHLYEWDDINKKEIGWDKDKTIPCTITKSVNIFKDVYIKFDRSMLPQNTKVSVSREVGTGLDPNIYNPTWTIKDPNNIESFKVYTFDLHGVTPGNVYKITVKGGTGNTCDKYGNILKDDYVQYIKFEVAP